MTKGLKQLIAAGAVLVLAAVAYGFHCGEEAAAVTVVGVVAAAAIAALTAVWRMQRQLEHDRVEREADRAHDRDLAALAELQKVLDEAAVGVHKLLVAVREVARTHLPPAQPAADRSAAAARGDVEQAALALDVLAIRVDLRLTAPGPARTLRRLRSLAARHNDFAAVIAGPQEVDPVARHEAFARMTAQFEGLVATFRRDAIAVTGAHAQQLGVELDDETRTAIESWSEALADAERERLYAAR